MWEFSKHMFIKEQNLVMENRESFGTLRNILVFFDMESSLTLIIFFVEIWKFIKKKKHKFY
jgi:hypothetical protein